VLIAAGWFRQRGVGYDAPMSLAIHLTAVENPELRAPLDPRPPHLDTRYPIHDIKPFLVALGDFVTESDFMGFLRAHDALYQVAVADGKEALEGNLQQRWFEEFFGEGEASEFHLVIGMLNWPHNYGGEFRVGHTRELYCIHGAVRGDRPNSFALDLPTIVHEFCHAYANPIIDRHAAELEAAGQILFSRVEDQMSRSAYGRWDIMLREYLVRASVIRYLAASEGQAAARAQVDRDRRRGFEYIEPLSDLLAEYESSRADYSTLDEFAPRIVAFFDSRADVAGREPLPQPGSARSQLILGVFVAVAVLAMVLAVRRLRARRAR
jgi:hypothetical protein